MGKGMGANHPAASGYVSRNAGYEWKCITRNKNYLIANIFCEVAGGVIMDALLCTAVRLIYR